MVYEALFNIMGTRDEALAVIPGRLILHGGEVGSRGLDF
jgi:hypothetical protein